MAGPTTFDRLYFRDLVDRLDVLLPAEERNLDLGLGTELPIALLPVRLETRFEESAGNTPWILKVRIIPDDIHIPTLDDGVTDREATLADQFRAAPQPGDEASWNALLASYGSGVPQAMRAAWLAAQAIDGPVAARKPSPKVARGLPARWYVSAWTDGALITSEVSSPVAPSLSVDPHGKADEIAWLSDFEAAAAAGMAVTLHVPSPSVDVLLAVGVRDGDGTTGASELADLLHAQMYSRGVDLLPPGTPTNNTPAVKAAWRSEPDAKEIARREFEPAVGTADGTNGRVLTAALGLPADTKAVSRPSAAGRSDQTDAAAMVDLLWPVTGGELLSVMLTDRTVTAREIPQEVREFVRDHTSRFVRGRGPLPTMLVGRQPYGVLPVGSLAKWVTDGQDPFLESMRVRLHTAWAVWESAVQHLPRLGGRMDAGAATQLIAQLLAQSPVPDPTGYRGTTIDPPNMSKSLPLFPIDGPLDGDLATGLLDLDWIPMISDCREDADRLGVVVLPAVAPGAGERLAQLPTGAGPIWLRVLNWTSAKEDLLSQLAQHALVRSSERAASYVSEFAAMAVQRPEFRSLASTALVQDIGSVGVSSPLDLKLADVGITGLLANETFSSYVEDPSKFADLELELPKESPEHRAAVDAVDRLQSLDDESLELLMGETLDLFTNRYDAWVTSLATRRLADLRAQHAEGVHLGGFGWLVDVAVPPSTPATAGHVHAPSPAHAATAAVLRHADLDDRAVSLDPSGNARRFDVTSASVRRARGILDAVRHGQPLSAVLGYHIERFLQDDSKSDLIDGLRHACGSVGGEPPDPTIVDLAVPAHDVVDGVAAWKKLDGREAPFDTPVYDPLRAELDFTVDALSDLLVAEGVHQLVRGDHTRAGATITALSRGLPPPADLHVVDTPGRHLALPVQLLMAADHGDVADEHGWIADRARARVAPAAERIARDALPHPTDVGIRLQHPVDPDHPNEPPAETVVTLAALGLAALDVLAETGDNDDQSALAARVRRHADQVGTILPDPADGFSVGWGGLTALARAWARVFASSRPLLHSDVEIGPGEHEAAAPAPSDAAVTRTEHALRTEVLRLTDAAADISAALASLGSATPTAQFLQGLEHPLDEFRRAGVAGSRQEPGDAPLDVARRCVAVAAVAAERIAKMGDTVVETEVQRAQRPTTAGGLGERTDKCVAAARDIFGSVVVAMPEIDCDDVATAPAKARAGLPGTDDLLDWFGELSEVRPATRRWWQALLASESTTSTSPTLVPSQFPAVKQQGWIGGWTGDAQEWVPPLGARRAFVVHTSRVLHDTGLCALVVESWVEQVPVGLEVELRERDSKVTLKGEMLEPTGVAIHHNAANARPPQSILLAVPPDRSTPNWHLGDLVATLLETIELSRMRAVEPPADLPSRTFLPAVFVPEGIDGLSFVNTLLEALGAGVLSVEATHWRRFGNG